MKFDITFVESKARGEQLPGELSQWRGDFILCYRSLFILPQPLLENTRIAAINFHPAPPEYPGSGCLNFALYDESEQYGVTAHIMNEKIDNGPILEARRFPIAKADTVDTLLAKTHKIMLEQFCDFIHGLASGGEAFVVNCRDKSRHETWNGDARTMRELEAMQVIDKDVSKTELNRVARATYTKLYPPKVIIHGYEFFLAGPKAQ
ncbi:MAG: hypothetical protein GY952_16910 [Rhodobacteraceae bacterium]|nr:hypothetical protein [Paracoccaceae bacterium]